MGLTEEMSLNSRCYGRFHLLVPSICLFIVLKGRTLLGQQAKCIPGHRQDLPVSPSKICKHTTEGHVCSLGQQTLSLGKAGFNYIISSSSPFSHFACRAQSSSGLNLGHFRKEVVVCRILDLDLIYCRCERMQGTAREEGKIWQEGPKDFVWRDWTLLKVSVEL